MRKARSERILQEAGIPFLPSLPCVESEEETELRTSEEVGIRICCLLCVAGTAFESGDSVFAEYLRKNRLWEHLSPQETSYLTNPTLNAQTSRNMTWRCEAAVVLMWAVRLFDDLPLPREETDTTEIVSRMPEMSTPPWNFIRALELRSKSEILDASDLIYRMHWATRQARIDGNKAPGGLVPGMVQEWHHAINWLTIYDEDPSEWDAVPTDT